MSGLDNATKHFKLIRSKDAGPFMLTIDLLFRDAATREAFLAADVFSVERIGALYHVDPTRIDIYDMPDIDALKISFPRPIPSGDFGDADITGGQQYSLVVDMLAGLDIDEGPPLLVRIPAPV